MRIGLAFVSLYSSGSGEFHVYRITREKEHKRLQHMKEVENEVKAEIEFDFKKRKLADEEEAKTAKKRAKRQRLVSLNGGPPLLPLPLPLPLLVPRPVKRKSLRFFVPIRQKHLLLGSFGNLTPTHFQVCSSFYADTHQTFMTQPRIIETQPRRSKTVEKNGR